MLQSAGTLRGGCMSRGWVAKAAQQGVTQQPAGASKRQTGDMRWRWRVERGGRWRWRVERQGCTKRMARREAGACREDERWRRCDNQPEGHTKRMSGGGDTTTSRARGMGGHGTTRGNGAMICGYAVRWAVAASVEAMQQPAGQEVHEAMAR
jgi:hypothetical protein